MDRKILKQNAKASLKSCNKNPYIITLVYLVILLFISIFVAGDNSISLTNSLRDFVAGVLNITINTGFAWWTLSIARGNDDTGEFKLAFTKIIYVVVVNFIVGIIVFIGFIILIIPGIIAALGLSMTTRCLRDDPDTGIFAAISKSWTIMKGHKWEFFVLQLSFLPWLFLTIITFFIVGIYVFPYIDTTISEFYESIKDQKTFDKSI